MKSCITRQAAYYKLYIILNWLKLDVTGTCKELCFNYIPAVSLQVRVLKKKLLKEITMLAVVCLSRDCLQLPIT